MVDMLMWIAGQWRICSFAVVVNGGICSCVVVVNVMVDTIIYSSCQLFICSCAELVNGGLAHVKLYRIWSMLDILM